MVARHDLVAQGLSRSRAAAIPNRFGRNPGDLRAQSLPWVGRQRRANQSVTTLGHKGECTFRFTISLGRRQTAWRTIRSSDHCDRRNDASERSLKTRSLGPPAGRRRLPSPAASPVNVIAAKLSEPLTEGRPAAITPTFSTRAFSRPRMERRSRSTRTGRTHCPDGRRGHGDGVAVSPGWPSDVGAPRRNAGPLAPCARTPRPMAGRAALSCASRIKSAGVLPPRA